MAELGFGLELIYTACASKDTPGQSLSGDRVVLNLTGAQSACLNTCYQWVVNENSWKRLCLQRWNDCSSELWGFCKAEGLEANYLILG